MKNNKKQNKKTVILARVSSHEQEMHGFSLGAQKKLLTDYHAQKKDYNNVKIYEIAETASKSQERKTFQKMWDFIEKNNVEILIVEKIDRLVRNSKDALEIEDWVKEKKGREIHCVKESFILSHDTKAHENLVWDMKVMMAKYYTNNLSEEVKKGNKQKIREGWIPKAQNAGYKTSELNGKKITVINPKQSPFVLKCFELMSTGNYSLKALTKKMNAEGMLNFKGKVMDKSTMYRTLTNPFYYGMFRWGGKIYKGIHTPIITKELFDAVQKQLTRGAGKPTFQTHFYTFKGKIRCDECNSTISWYDKKGHMYGRCNHYHPCTTKGCVRQEIVEKQLLEILDKIEITNPKILVILNKALKESHAEESAYLNSKRNSLTKQLEITTNRLETMYIDKLDGKITDDFYEKNSENFTEDKENVLLELGKLENSRDAYYNAGYHLHKLFALSSKIYKSKKSTTEDKRSLIGHIFSNFTLKGAKLAPNYTATGEFLMNWLSKIKYTFEPGELCLTKRKIESLDPTNLVLHGWRESNPR